MGVTSKDIQLKRGIGRTNKKISRKNRDLFIFLKIIIYREK